MKVSISLPEEDLEFLDAYVQAQGLGSRSAALHKAVRLLRGSELTGSYEESFVAWAASEDATDWGTTVSDGL